MCQKHLLNFLTLRQFIEKNQRTWSNKNKDFPPWWFFRDWTTSNVTRHISIDVQHNLERYIDNSSVVLLDFLFVQIIVRDWNLVHGQYHINLICHAWLWHSNFILQVLCFISPTLTRRNKAYQFNKNVMLSQIIIDSISSLLTRLL